MTTQALQAPMTRTPDALDALGEGVADRINPIVVKELRQHLRTRTFWVFFSLMLLACLGISLVAFVTADESEKVGLVTFFAFYTALSGVQHFVIPYTAYRSMAREQEDETWVLLSLTGLGPRRILAGKLTSFVLQGLLYASAAAPFLLFSYYLNGIDLPTIAVAITMGGAFQVFLVSVAVSIATLAESRLVRSLLHFVVLGALAIGAITGTSLTIAASEELHRTVPNAEFWLGAGSVLFAMVTTALLLFESAASRLSMPTEAYARGPRTLFVVQALGGLAAFVVGWLIDGDDDILAGAAVALSCYLAFVGLFIASDRDSMARNHWATSGRWALLAPGALRGFVLVLLVMLVGTAVLVGCYGQETEPSPEVLNLILGAPAYLVLYLSASLVLARLIPHPPWQTPAMVRLVALGLFTIGAGVPPLVGAVVSEGDDRTLNMLNPVVGLVNATRDGGEGLVQVVVVWGVAAVVLVVALAVVLKRDVRWA
ncbi:MAG: ABC transporter permease [Myxococcaceae bacterium]|nr:ABC transporter permease [Myxococcaceae bacterium]